MVVPQIDPGASLLLYGGLLVAVPLSAVLLGRALAQLDLDGYVDQYQEFPREAGQGFDEIPAPVGDEGTCPQCGAHNEPDYTFCRSCQAQIGP